MSDNGDKATKPGLLRRLFGGGAAAPESPPDEVASAAETSSTEAEAALVAAPLPPVRLRRPWPHPGAATQAPAVKRTWLQRLRAGLALSSTSIGRGVTDIFTKRKLDAESLDDLEDVLIQADLGLAAATRVREAIGRGRYEKSIDPETVKAILAAEVERLLAPVARPLVIDPSKRPFVILVVGVNGSGKTTTIGKLAATCAARAR